MEQINNIEVVPCTSSNYMKPFRVHYSQNGTRKSWDFMRTHDSVSILIFNTSSHCFILVKQFRPAVYMCEWEKHKSAPAGKEAGEAVDGAGKSADEAAEAGDKSAEAGDKSGEAADQAGEAGDQADEERHPHLPPASAGVTYELCAGIVDKLDLSLEEIARQEILEECGYDVPVTKLRRITSYRSGVGVTGSRQTLFYAEVSDEDCVGEGGGEPQEGELIEVVKVPLQEAMNFAYDESIPKTMSVLFSFLWFQSNMAPKYKISTNV